MSPILRKGSLLSNLQVSEILAMTAPKAQSSVTNDELKTDTAQNSTGKISSHMLCLEMRGPQGANFSFIDTPGVPLGEFPIT